MVFNHILFPGVLAQLVGLNKLFKADYFSNLRLERTHELRYHSIGMISELLRYHFSKRSDSVTNNLSGLVLIDYFPTYGWARTLAFICDYGK